MISIDIQKMLRPSPRKVNLGGELLSVRNDIDVQDISYLHGRGVSRADIKAAIDVAKLDSISVRVAYDRIAYDRIETGRRQYAEQLVTFVGPVGFLISLLSDEELRRIGVKQSDTDTLEEMSQRVHSLRADAFRAHKRLKGGR